jgi:hypothetical protein
MKRLLMMSVTAAVLSLLLVSVVTAEGAQERWDGSDRSRTPYYNGETLSIEGTVELTASGVELKAADGQKYELMYPRFLAADVQVRDGDTALVEGYLVPGPRWGQDDGEKYLRVERVTIGGEEYELAGNFAPGSGFRTGAWGPGACRGYGYGGYGPQGSGYGPGAGNPRGGYGGRGPGMMGGSGYRW